MFFFIWVLNYSDGRAASFGYKVGESLQGSNNLQVRKASCRYSLLITSLKENTLEKKGWWGVGGTGPFNTITGQATDGTVTL